MTVKLEKADYDFYRVKIPFSKMIGKKRNLFLWNELEKKHPCFSNRNAVDCKFQFGTGGLFANLTVTEKSVLLDYKSRYPKAMLVTEEENRVFDGKKKTVLLFLAVSLLICFILFLQIRSQKEVHVNEEVSVPVISENVPKKVEKSTSVVEDFFRILGTDGEKIREFSWSYVKGVENCSVSLSDIDPLLFMGWEKLLKRESFAQYKNNIVSCVLEFSNPVSVSENALCSLEDRKAFINGIRKHLEQYDCNILSETFGENGTFYRLNVESTDLSFFKDSEENPVFTASEYDLSCLKITASDSGKYLCLLEFNDSYTSPFKNRIPEIIVQKTSVFKKELVKEKNIQGRNAENKPLSFEQKTEGLRKFGVISHGTDPGTVFYKNEKGRIVSEKEVY